MATLDGSLHTIYDWAKMLAPNGSIAKVAEVLSQKNQIIDKILFKEGNLPTGHRATIDSALPAPVWRMLNQGVAPTSGSTAQIDFQCGMLADRSHVDVKLAKLNGNVKAYRMAKAKQHIEGMSQEMASTMFYGSAAAANEFVGFANYYTSTSAANGENILLAGGSGSDQTSIYLMGFGEGVYGIFPKGSSAGLNHQDLGEDDVDDANGNPYRAYKDLFEWDAGLVVEDWRYGARIANIEVSDLLALTSTQAVTASTSIIKLMTRLIDRIPDLNACTPYFMVNRTVASNLRIIAMEKSSSAVTIEAATNQFGKTIHQLTVHGIPVAINDCIVNTETAIS